MNAQEHKISKLAAALTCILGVISLTSGLLLPVFSSRAYAAVSESEFITNPRYQQDSCDMPSEWEDTTRLFYQRQKKQEWTFTVDEPEMDVSLEFFWYQDYSPEGCPFDCSTGECQLDETGKATTPLGSFTVSDGSEGATGGSKTLEGRLKQGTYTTSFVATGKGSINIGLNIEMESVPTTPPVSENTPTSTPTAISTEPPIESTSTPTPTPTDQVLPPASTATFTPTATGTVPLPAPEETSTPTATFTQPPAGSTSTPTATPTDEVLPPGGSTSTPTATPTDQVLPPVPSSTLTPTPTDREQPPVSGATATPTDQPRRERRPTHTPTPTSTPGAIVLGPVPTATALSTLPPPAATTQPGQQALIPNTGADLLVRGEQEALTQRLLLKLGAGLLGLALVLFGTSRKR